MPPAERKPKQFDEGRAYREKFDLGHLSSSAVSWARSGQVSSTGQQGVLMYGFRCFVLGVRIASGDVWRDEKNQSERQRHKREAEATCRDSWLEKFSVTLNEWGRTQDLDPQVDRILGVRTSTSEWVPARRHALNRHGA
jgi:hypothetical protein